MNIQDITFLMMYIFTGVDPGIFVRGVQLSDNFDKQKKKKKKRGQKTGGCDGSFL